MARVNILKQVKVVDRWKLVSIPQDKHARKDWKALPDGRYFIEWWECGKRKRQAAGVTVADALDAARRRKHILEGRALGVRGYEAEEEAKRTPFHSAVKKYLDVVEGLKKPNTLRKYKAVLNRFVDYFTDRTNAQSITPDDLNDFMVWLKRNHRLNNNSVIHNLIIVAQFLKKQGRPGLSGSIELPEAVRSLPEEYSDKELNAFFEACTPEERTLFATFLLTGFREQEVVHLIWDDINFNLNTVRVTAKPDLGFSPKRWEEREVPVPKRLIGFLKNHPHANGSRFVFPSPRGNRELHMLDKCKEIATRAKLDPTRFHLRKFRSTYATRMLRAGFDVRTVQHWMGHKSLETTMRYLAPAKDVHERLDRVQIAGVLGEG
ncbi:MAG TPA: tyrosine-type recombinase/integrase [Terriglobia bacterium]|nr:tyrosine-type recombinase/integrase [Terriglobia bacterium]